MKTLSIITITFNNFEQLVLTLKSIYPLENLEIIVINGGNDQNAKNYLSQWIIDNPQHQLLQEKDSGIADAFNKGIKLAKGKYINFLNSGDIMGEHEYYSLALNMLETNSNIFFTHADIIFQDQYNSKLRMPARNNIHNLGLGMPFHHQTMIVRKSLFDSIGLFNLNFRFAMDYEWIIRLVSQGHRGYYFPHIGSIMDGNGVSISQENKSMNECFKALKINNQLNIKTFYGFVLRKIFKILRVAIFLFMPNKIIGLIKQINNQRF